MLAVVVTVQSFVPEFTVTHLLAYSLITPLCGQWNVQWLEPEHWLCFSVGFYSTWLRIWVYVLSCGAIPQDLCRSLFFSLPLGGEIMWQLFFESLDSFYRGMRLKNVGHSVCLLNSILNDSNLPVTRGYPRSFIVVFTAPETTKFGDSLAVGSMGVLIVPLT